MIACDPRPLIAHVLFRFDVGGLENGVVNLINQMPSHRWRHAVVALDRIAPDFARRVQRQDVQYVELGKPPGHLVWHYPRLFRVINDLRPAVVHTRNLAALEATVPAFFAGVPVRIHGEHGWDVDDLAGANKRHRWVRRLYRPFVSRYVALSRHQMNYLTAVVGVRSDAVVHICNGVDTRRFRPPVAGRAGLTGSPFTDPAEWLVGTVGRLAPVKDQVALARAFVRARTLDAQAARRMRLIIVGNGPLRETVRQVLDEGRAAECAWLAGERSDIPEVMRALDTFVLPSLAEGISNTILEAMASGLPVIATNVGGNSELIDDGISGHLVPPADPEHLADAILEMFRDRERAQRYGRAAREAAERRFSLERMVSDYCAVYQASLKSAGAAPADVEQASSTTP